MSIRRVAVLIAFVALFAVVSFGQIAPPILPSGAGCTPATNAPPCAFANISYSVTLTSSLPNGFSQIWVLTGNPTIPPGLSISNTGVLSGIPTTTGTYTFQVSATYAGNPDPPVTQNYTLVISGTSCSFSITTTSLPSGVLNTPYSAAIQQSGGSGVTWSVVTGSGAPGPLPPGLGINPSTGAITGTPTSVGSYPFQVLASYPCNGTTIATSPTLTIVINATAGALSMATPANVSGTVGQTVSMQFSASGGVTPYTYTLTSGTYPPGLNLNAATGLVSGTATGVGAYPITIQVTDSTTPTAQTASATATITISGSVTPLTMSNPATVTGNVGQTVSMQFSASGGVTPYTYSLLSGTPPQGLTLNSQTGLVTGQATAIGSSTFTVLVTDSTSPTHATTSATGTITINAATLTMANPSNVTGNVGQTVTMQFSASGGVSPYTYSLLSGTPPQGLNLNSQTGVVTGQATAVGTSTFTVQVTDSASHTATAQGTITINAATLTLTSPNNISGQAGQSVTMQFSASGGVTPYTYSVLSGSLPPGLTLNATTGAVTGQPTQLGTSTFTVQVTDAANHQASATGTITVTLGLTASPTTVSGSVGQTMSPWMQFTAIGGTAPYTYAFVNGTLPAGLTLNSQTGAITGTATSANQYAFIIQVTDANGLQAAAQGNINITLISLTGVGVTISPSGALTVSTQPAVALSIASAPVENITGTLSVAYSRSADGGSSREVVFIPNGSGQGVPFVTFTIAAGSTQAVFTNGPVVLKAGTAAGFGTLTATFQDALGNNITPQNLLPVTFSVAGTPPVISAFTVSCNGTTYSASVIGFSSPLDMTNAVFNFTGASNVSLAASSVTVPLGPLFAAWFESSQSNQYGGQFMLTVPFTFTTSAGSSTNPIVAMTVTLTNSKGTSSVSSPASPNPACN